MLPIIGDEVRNAIRIAMRRPEIRERVQAIHAEVERELDRIKPRCEMSGRCCRFEEYGHRLFVTTAELAVFAAAATKDLAVAALLENADNGGCRFQQARLCVAHAIRPMGCRLFFCDAAHADELRSLFERMHARLKAMHDELSIPYYYVEWRSGLDAIGPLIIASSRGAPKFR